MPTTGELNPPYAGPLVVGESSGGPYEARWLNSYQNVYATATLYANGIVNLNNHNEDFGAVTFNGGTLDSGPSGHFVPYAPLTVNPAASSAVIKGNLGLNDSADPIFIVGHWRTGTTLLHEFLILDDRHNYPTTYECLEPNHFLLTEGLVTRWLRFLAPSRRKSFSNSRWLPPLPLARQA